MTANFPAAALEPETQGPLILALPKGRILAECGPLLARAGIVPAADYLDESSRRLRFETSDPSLDVVRVRSFDVATFVAFGAAQIGICGADDLMEFDYPEHGVGRPRRVLIQSPQDIAHVKPFDIERADRPRQRIESVRKMAQALGRTHSVLGWVEGPLALYADLRGVESMFLDLIDNPQMYHSAAEIIIENQIRFARAQIGAGADMIGVGDAVASQISPAMYRQFVLPFERRLFQAIHEAGATVKLHICGDIRNSVRFMAQTGCDILDVDWMVPLDEARAVVGPDVTLAGNFDPAAVLLQGTPQEVADAARRNVEMGGRRFILQPGCEVPPGTAEQNIRAFFPCQGCRIPGQFAGPR